MSDRSPGLSHVPSSTGTAEDFFVSQPLEVRHLLRQMADQNVMVVLTAPGGASYASSIWEVDVAARQLVLGADPPDRAIERIVGADDVAAVGYLDQVKIQFDVSNLMQVRAADGSSVMTCLFPSGLYRFQRRANFRVRPFLTPVPMARLRTGAQNDVVELRVLDVSVTGLALLMPEGMLAIGEGARLPKVEVELDAETRFTTDLRIMHVRPLNLDVPSVRLGCELTGLAGASLRSLQRFIDQTQKRRRATVSWED